MNAIPQKWYIKVEKKYSRSEIVVVSGLNFKVTVQPFEGTKIEEKTCNLLQKILGRVLKSFAHFPM